MAKSKIDTNKPKDIIEKDINIHLCSGTTQVRYHNFPYMVPYLEKALKNIQFLINNIPSRDIKIPIPYTIYNRFINDYKKFNAKAQEPDKINVLWDHNYAGYLSQSDKLWTHKCKYDSSLALNRTREGNTCYGDDYYLTNKGMILHLNNFESSFI